MRHPDDGGGRSGWRLFPWAVGAGLGVVILVNAGMAYTALSTFPGTAGGDGFDLSNHYDAILDHMDQQAKLGWDIAAKVDAAGHPVIVVTDRSGQPLMGVGVAGTAHRVVGDEHATALRFRETAPGHYASDLVLDEKGQWELLLTASAGGRDFSTTRRIVVR